MVMVLLGMSLPAYGQATTGATQQPSQAPPTIDEALIKAEELIDGIEELLGKATEPPEDDYNLAVKYCKYVKEVDPLNVKVGYLEARLAILGGRPREALPLIEAYVNDPVGATDWEAHNKLGDLYILSYPKHALAQYREASRLAPQESDPYHGLARAEIKLTNGEEAVEHSRNAIRNDQEEHAEYRKTLAKAFLLLDNKFEEAARAAREAVEIAERQFREHPDEVGRLAALDEYYKLLIDCYNRQYVAYPERVEVLVNIVRATLDRADLTRLTEYQSALILVRQARKQPKLSDSNELLYEQARLCRLLGRDNDAAALLEELLKRDPNHRAGQELMELVRPQVKTQASAKQ